MATYQVWDARRNLSPANMDDEHSSTPASKGFPFLTPISIQPPCIRDFQFQLIGGGSTPKLHKNVQPLAFSPVTSPGHISPTSGLSTMQRPLSPARPSRRPLLDRLGQPQTQLVPEMHDETALPLITNSSASHSALSGIATSHSQLSHVLHAVPPLERKTPNPAEFQMQADTDASEPTHQDVMDLDGGSPLPWQNPFDEPDEAHSVTIRKFRLADVFAVTAKVTEEWSKVERPQIPLPKRRRPPQVTSPTTRAGTKASLHKLSPRVVARPFDNRDADRRSWPSPNVDRATVSNIAAVPVLEAPLQSPSLTEHSVSRSLDTVQRIQRLQEIAGCGDQESGQATGTPTPNPAVQSCGSPPPTLGDTGTVSSLPFNALDRISARPHARLTLHAPLATVKPLTIDGGLQSVEKTEKGHLSAPERTFQPASYTAVAQSTGPSVCRTHLSPPNSPVSLFNGSEAPGAMTMRPPTRPSSTVAAPPVAAPLPPPAPPQQVKTEPMEIKVEPCSPKIHPPAQPITVAEVLGVPTEATGRSPVPGFAATPLDRRASATLRDIPLTSPPAVDLLSLLSFNVEARPPPATLEQETPTTALQPNTMTESRSFMPALAIRLPSVGPTIPPQLESTAMDMQMTQPEQRPFVPRTPPRQPNHTGPMYYSPAPPPPVSRYRRSASPPPRGQSFIRARTPPRGVTPQRLSPRRTPTRAHPRYARGYTDSHTQTDSDGQGRRRRERIDFQMNSYRLQCADDRSLSGFGREGYHPSHGLEPMDRAYSRDWSREGYHPKSTEMGSVPPAQYRRDSQSECYIHREPNVLEWSHPTRRDLETSEMDHQVGSSRQRYPTNDSMSLFGRSACTRLDTGLPPYPRADSGPRSIGSPSYSRDVNWGSSRSETLQVNSRVSSIGPLAPSVQIDELAPASKRPRESESSPSPEDPLHSTKSISTIESAPKRQRVNTPSSRRQTGGNSQPLVGTAPYRLEPIVTYLLQETPIGDMVTTSSSQPTLADRMGVLNNPSSTQQSPPEPSRGPLISRFAYGSTLPSISQPALEDPDKVSPPTVTRPLLERFMSNEESSNQAHTHRGARFRGRSGRNLVIPPSGPSVLRHQPLGQRLSRRTHVKNNSLLERME
jgi:hypothetical protein